MQKHLCEILEGEKEKSRLRMDTFSHEHGYILYEKNKCCSSELTIAELFCFNPKKGYGTILLSNFEDYIKRMHPQIKVISLFACNFYGTPIDVLSHFYTKSGYSALSSDEDGIYMQKKI